jgi:eukaryotic-like serine/threonine-protein kinase
MSNIASIPTVSGGNVYFGAGDKYVYALNATTGALQWRYLTGNPLTGGAQVAGGSVYIGSGDKYLYDLDATAGTLNWRYQMGGSAYGVPAAKNNVVYIGADDKVFYAINTTNGTLAWHVTTDGIIKYSSPTIYYGFNYGGILYDIIYFGTENGTIYAFFLE